MSDSPSKPDAGTERAVLLVAAHVCPNCGAATQRSQVSPESIISGLVKCPECGSKAGLNVQVVENPNVPKPPVSVKTLFDDLED